MPFFLLELVGTVAFAVSGAVTALLKKMDAFGVVILAMTTAVGGGIIRDVILNITPPIAFQKPVFALTSLAVGLGCFLITACRLFRHKPRFYDQTLLVMDSLGLGIFSVTGVQAAFSAVPGANVFLAVFTGVLTGVGGGVLRDILAGNTPVILVKHFYACASVIGALLCSLFWHRLDELPAMILGAATTFILRMLAAHFHWSLPKINHQIFP